MSDMNVDIEKPHTDNIQLQKNKSHETSNNPRAHIPRPKKSLLTNTLLSENPFMSPGNRDNTKKFSCDISEILEVRSLVYEEATDVLQQQNHFENPFQKMTILLSAKNYVYKEIKDFQKSESLKVKPVDSQNQLLILEYLLYNSECDDIPAHLEFTRELLPRNYIQARCGHYITHFQMATKTMINEYLSHVESQDINKN